MTGESIVMLLHIVNILVFSAILIILLTPKVTKSEYFKVTKIAITTEITTVIRQYYKSQRITEVIRIIEIDRISRSEITRFTEKNH